MAKEYIELATQIAETTLDNCRKIAELNLKTTSKLVQEQLDLCQSLFTAACESADKAGGVKDLQGAAANTAELAQECGQILVECSQNCAEAITEAGKQYGQLFEAGVRAANANAQKAASAAASAAKNTASAAKKTA